MNTNPLKFLETDWTPLSVILGAPLFGAFFNGVFGKRVGKNGVRLMALFVMAVSFLAAVYSFVHLHTLHHEAEEAAVAAQNAWKAANPGKEATELLYAPSKLSWLAWSWMSMASASGFGRMDIDVKFSVDELSGVMMLIITGIGFLIHLYSTSYMAKDPGYHRFFAYLNLFIFAMLTLVLADNMPLLFVGWEGVGLCSYLLIGFWFENGANTIAGRKAFIANRVGDVGIIAGMLLIAYYTRALDWAGIDAGSIHLTERIPYAFTFFSNKPVDPATAHSVSAATITCIALFIGCTGKSAQIPLYVWLPDAMAGPTPVSALIHAATMVTSGLYLICRLNHVFTLSPFAMAVVATTGAVTAFFAATIALVQNDIKKVLAYSTVSQLGFMFLGVGVGAFTAGFFHVFTHAFFKACLFLGAGSVIHAMHARIHDDVKSQDMRFMGGLKKYMPWTFVSMAVATAAISGFPGTSGFFSKDGILFHLWTNTTLDPMRKGTELELARLAKAPESAAYKAKLAMQAQLWDSPVWLGKVLFVIAILAATMTAFYMFRLLFKTFYGEFRGWQVAEGAPLATDPFANDEGLEDDDHAHDAQHDDHQDPHHDAHHQDADAPGDAPKEAPWQMALPVAILGVFAAFGGFFYAEPLHIEPLGHWLEPVFAKSMLESIKVADNAHKIELVMMVPGILAFLIGSGLAYWMYITDQEKTADSLVEQFPGLHRTLYNKWYVDELYEATVIGGTDALADGAALMDQWVVDGIIAKLTAAIAQGLGAIVRLIQDGIVQTYAAILAGGALLLTIFFVMPHAEATIRQKDTTYTVEAAPGLGYEYRWDTEGTNPTGDFSSRADATQRVLTLKQYETKQVALEVRNAFGRTSRRIITVGTPAPAPSASTSASASASAGAVK
jgi:NADH-quinone oxidoreductase subunit L